MEKYGNSISTEDYEEYKDDLTPLLMESSAYLNNIIQKHKNNPQMISKVEKLIWWVDMFLMNKVAAKAVTKDGLKYRLDRIKELLT
jgi:hypothetical protein